MKPSLHYLITLSILLAHGFNQCVQSHSHHQHYHDDHHDKRSYKNNRNLVSFKEIEESRELLGSIGRCHQSEPSIETKNMSNQVFKKWMEDHPCDDSRGESNPQCRGNLRSTTTISPIKIQVYIHVIRNDDGSGIITESQVEKSMAVLNESYKPYFEFVFESDKHLDYTYNSNWYNTNYLSYKEMAVALNKGTCDDLNIYFLKPANSLGWAKFPWDCTESADSSDGVFVSESSVPDGSFKNFNKGYTLVHEVGHWFGLWHTFWGGCAGAGDEVSDTPAQAYSTEGCPVGKDTCPGGGVDPIDNFMDYSFDTCMERFTDGQFSRMIAMHDTYRNKFPDETTVSSMPPKCDHDHKYDCQIDPSCQWKRGSCKKRVKRRNDSKCAGFKSRNKCNKNRSNCCRWGNNGACKRLKNCEPKIRQLP